MGVPHKHAGTFLAARYLPEQFGAVVYGHHGGLPDTERLAEELTRIRGDGELATMAAEAIGLVEKIIPEIHPDPRPPLPAWLTGLALPEARLGVDLLMRMLFSCVVDADYLDTESHFDAAPVRLRPQADFAALLARYEERRSKFLADRPPSPVDAVRQNVYEQACEAAARPPGMYVLHVPTGGAKTIAAGGFALRHAQANGLGRVVLAVPYISITQQNAAVYRELLEPDAGSGERWAVLEHHSSVDLDQDGGTSALTQAEKAEAAERSRWSRLAAENWDAPFVITTTVQLFESLFSSKPSAMRKLHRLAGSVIVLDEVQALPDRLLRPVLSALRGLVDHFGATVVLVSATQPSFWSLQGFAGVERRSLVRDVAGLFEQLRRVRYEWRVGPDVTLAGMAAEAVEHAQTLTVVNTTKDAATLHRLIEDAAAHDATVIHLSTRMTAGHRREAIDQVRTLLAQGRAVHVVSTQLIEAGVDLDFPRVYRAWAPVESMQQAAGRCNRDGRLSEGVVVVFTAADAGQPKGSAYEAALTATGMYFGPGLADPDDLAALERYYPQRYALQQGTQDSGLGAEIEELRRNLDFPEVATRFQMIEDGLSRPVVVIRREDERDAIEAAVAMLRSPYPRGPEVLRGLQPHIASLPRHEAEAAVKSGLADPVIGDLLLWHGDYDQRRGLDPSTPEDRAGFVV
ncbi:CRISPR-associated endonuclease/helicase Cas3 [Streptacidiphilus sp. MAP12-16]